MSSAPSIALRNLLAELEQLFQTETEARVAISVRAAERALAEHLNQSVRRLAYASNFGEIASVLCEASAAFCNGCAVFHVTGNIVIGEHVRGAAPDAAARFHGIRFNAAEAAAFAGALESREPVAALCSVNEVGRLAELFRHSPEDRAHLFPIPAGKQLAGLVYAAGTVEPAGLELLAQAAALVLGAREHPAPAVAAPPTQLVQAIEPASSTTDRNVGGADGLKFADQQVHLKAQRFARVRVAEMRLYHAEAVAAGRARGDLYAVLQQAIDSGRDAFRQTFLPASPTMVDYFHQELLRTLANETPAAMGERYPGPLV
jgi:hypothetical protein